MSWKQRLLIWGDRGSAMLIVVLVLGGVAAFGGAVWWFRPAAAVLASLLALIQVVRFFLVGKVVLLKSPIGGCALAVIGLALVQLAPLPPPLARRLSPLAQAVYSRGVIPELAARDAQGFTPSPGAQVRSPASLDRPATLRFMVAAAVCLAVFFSVSHFADRLRRLYLVLGSVIAAFLLNGAIALVNLSCGVEGIYGCIQPGQTAAWGPTWDDLLDAPGVAQWVPVSSKKEALVPVMLVPERPAHWGTMMGGPGALLALGSLALPATLGVLIHLVAPRGSRESLSLRLKQTRQGGLVVLMVILLLPTTFAIGMAAGASLIWPFLLSSLVVGVPSSLVAGSRRSGPTFTVAVCCLLLAGAACSKWWEPLLGTEPPVRRLDASASSAGWAEAAAVLAQAPLVGIGLGALPAIEPYLKASEDFVTAGQPSLCAFVIESGLAGIVLLALVLGWCCLRIPRALQLVGAADRALAQGLLGAALGFTVWSAVAWTIALPAVAISASAVLGAGNRFLCGGADLFVDHG